MTTYFACVSDSKNFESRAIFIPMKNISKELLEKITRITSLGNLIGDVYKFDGNIGKNIGYNIEGNFEVSQEISDIVNFFQGLINFLEMDGFRDVDDDYGFDIDDDNCIRDKSNSLTNVELKKEIEYPDNYNGIPIDYPNILFWFVDVKTDQGWENILMNYKDLDGEKINLFDYVVIETQTTNKYTISLIN